MECKKGGIDEYYIGYQGGGRAMKKMKPNIDWSNVVAFMLMISAIATGCLFIAWVIQISEQDTQNVNTEARCKSAGGEMGYSKCYKDGKEI